MKTKTSSYQRHRFPSEIISHAVWLLSLLKIHPSDFKIPFPFRLASQVVMQLVWCIDDEGPRQRGWP